MKVSFFPLLASLLLVRAGDTPTETSEISAADLEEYNALPAVAGHRYRGPDQETNAERMKRGANPSRPRKLYSAVKQFSRRAGEPAQAMAPASQNSAVPAKTYDFVGCSLSLQFGPSSMGYSVSYSDLQDLVNQCAGKQDPLNNKAGEYQGFLINPTAVSGGTNCRTSTRLAPGSTASQDCAGSLAIYIAQ